MFPNFSRSSGLIAASLVFVVLSAAYSASAQLVRIDEDTFKPTATQLTFSEPGRSLGDLNPVYNLTGVEGIGDIDVTFRGRFVGQTPGTAPGGADSLDNSMPTGPLMLDLTGPNTEIVSDGANPTSPVLSGEPTFDGTIAVRFSKPVAAVGLDGGFFDTARSTAIEAYDADGNVLGRVVNTGTGIEFFGLRTADLDDQIAGISFFVTGDEPSGFAIDNLTFGSIEAISAFITGLPNAGEASSVANTMIFVSRTIGNVHMTNIGHELRSRRKGSSSAVMLAQDDSAAPSGWGFPENALAMADGDTGSALALAMAHGNDRTPPARRAAARGQTDPLAGTHIGVWGTARYSFGDQENTDAPGEANYHVPAGTVGVDYEFSDQVLVIGLAFGYAATDTDLINSGELKIDGYTGMLYVTWTPTDRLYIDGAIGGSYLEYDQQREPGGGEPTAQADTEGYQFAAQIRAGMDFTKGNFVFGPVAGLAITETRIDGYTETGSPDKNLTVEDLEASSLVQRLGGQVTYIWDLSETVTIAAQARAVWAHEYLDDDRTIHLAGGGAVFEFPHDHPARDWAEVGVGVSSQIANWTVFLNYDATLANQDYDGHTISGGLRLAF